MSIFMLDVGNEFMIKAEAITVISPYEGSHIKNVVRTKRQQEKSNPNGSFVDATLNKKTRSVIICNDGTFVTSTVKPKTLMVRLFKEKPDIC